jgi:hypothetical protein
VCVRVWVCRLSWVHVYLIDRQARRPRHFFSDSPVLVGSGFGEQYGGWIVIVMGDTKKEYAERSR